MVPWQARYSGTVPEAWDSPETLELFQNPRVPTPWGFIFFPNLRDLSAWDRLMISGSLSECQKPGTVPGLWDFPKIPESWHHGVLFFCQTISRKSNLLHVGLWVFATVPKTRSPNIFWGFIFSQSPNTTGFGTVPEARDVETVLKTQSFNLRDPKAWDSPRTLGRQ